MRYGKRLPKIKELRQFASEVRDFPITGQGIVQYAEHLGYDDWTINFLNLFSRRMVFNSRSDFIQHCSLLERLLRQSKQTPVERVLSPQG